MEGKNANSLMHFLKTCRMQKEQFSRFEKLEAVVDELKHVHVEIRTEHTRSSIEK